jgi:hypothetical protein
LLARCLSPHELDEGGPDLVHISKLLLHYCT